MNLRNFIFMRLESRRLGRQALGAGRGEKIFIKGYKFLVIILTGSTDLTNNMNDDGCAN